MTTIVHLLAIAFATAIAAALIYWLIRKYEPQLAKGTVIIFAVFGGLLTSVAAIKTNSPPARVFGHSCGLEDIYHTAPPNSYPNQPQIVEDVRFSWLPDDWGSTSQTEHFYTDNHQRAIIETLLMLGAGTNKGDLSFGDIHGIWFHLVDGEKIYRTSMVPVGVSNNLNRNPRHAQPGN